MFARGLLLAALVTSCGGGPRNTDVQEVQLSPRRMVHRNMRAVYYAALHIEKAVVDGRLTDARESAAWIATHGDQFSPPAEKGDELLQAADTVAQSRSILEAAGGLGRLGRACANCHLASQATVDFAFATFHAPVESTELAGQMLRHEWAAERLWQGLLAPSDTAWNEGAELLATTAIDLAATTNAKPNVEAVELANHLREMAASAASADPTQRSIELGTMIVTCARCHDLVRVHPVAGDR
ncbi:hypothetical protein BH11MYX2_BH11MYX2_08710 [soil metagenome]